METTNTSLARNSSDNFSQAVNSTSRKYVFAPVSYHVKLIIFTAMLSFGVYGMIWNSLILYFKRKQHRRRRRTIQRAFSRSLTEYFINSLALSDVLCSLISLPLFAAEMFIDFVHNDWICKVNRFLNFIFPVITILNFLVIRVERYFGIFHVFRVPSRMTAKKIVVGAWVLGVLITLVPMPTYKRIHFDIEQNSYTLICKYDNTLSLYRSLFVSFMAITYIIPCIILIFINIRILRYMRHSRRVAALGNANFARSYLARFKVTRMFFSLIFAFIIPYFLFIVYNGIMNILRPKISFTGDYVARHMNALLGYANGAVSATILFHNESSMRKMLVDMLRWWPCSPCQNVRIFPTGKNTTRTHPSGDSAVVGKLQQSQAPI